MGGALAQRAMREATKAGIGHRSARLLAWIAVGTLDRGNDDNPAGTYYKGREDLAIGLGYAAPANGSPAARQAVKEAVRELVAAGLIECEEEANGGRHSRYRIVHGNETGGVSHTTSGGASDTT